MVSTEDALNLYRRLSDNGVQVWLSGGWGIDALLGRQTRPHKDLDAILLLDDMIRMKEILCNDGYVLKELWSENRWVVDGQGNRTATAFVLQDGENHEFDVHAISLDDRGNGVPAWEEVAGFDIHASRPCWQRHNRWFSCEMYLSRNASLLSYRL